MKTEKEKSGKTRRQLQAEITREKIYSVAFRLMTEKGFENITIDEICRESGVAKGSFYNHFKSKDDIVIEIYKIVDEEYSAQVYTLPEDLNSIEKIIMTVGFQATFANARGVRFVRQIYKSQLESGTDFFISEDRPYFRILREIIEVGMKRGEINDSLSAEELTRWIISFSRGITYDWCLHDGNYSIEEVMQRTFRTILSGFKITPKDTP